LLVPVNSLYALQTLKLVLLPLNSTSLRDTRDKFSEQLRVELINSQEFIVIDPFVVREAMIEQGVVIGGDIDRQAVIEVGKGVNADIVLSGTLGREGETYRLTLDMISTVKGQSVYAETYDISDKSYVKDIRSLTEQLVEHGRLITQITLEDVKTLLEVGQFKEAQYALRTYLDFHEENNSVAHLQEMVHEGLARSAY
jgi:TolB-like protein